MIKAVSDFVGENHKVNVFVSILPLSLMSMQIYSVSVHNFLSTPITMARYTLKSRRGFFVYRSGIDLFSPSLLCHVNVISSLLS